MPLKRIQSLVQALDHIEPDLIDRRVARLREQFPGMSKDELHRVLVRGKCLQAGAAGALQGMIDLVPGGRIVAPRVLGPLAEPQLIAILQAELVLETLAVYQLTLSPAMRQALITGLGAAEAPAIAIEKLLEHDWLDRIVWVSRLRWLNRSLIAKRLLSAAADPMSETYAIGERAAVIAKMPQAKLADWPGLIAKAVRLDESRLAQWAMEATRSAAQQAQSAFSQWFDGLASWSSPVRGLVESLEPLTPTDEIKTPPRARAKARADAPAPARKRVATRARAPTQAQSGPTKSKIAPSQSTTKASNDAASKHKRMKDAGLMPAAKKRRSPSIAKSAPQPARGPSTRAGQRPVASPKSKRPR